MGLRDAAEQLTVARRDVVTMEHALRRIQEIALQQVRTEQPSLGAATLWARVEAETRVRPASESPIIEESDVWSVTCDAGCDRRTVAVIQTDVGWLSVCANHALQSLEGL